MIYTIFTTISFLLFSILPTETNNISTEKLEVVVKAKSSFESKAEMIYQSLEANNLVLPNQESFQEALRGFYLLKEKGLIQKEILTLIDFGLSSNIKRLWVIDLTNNTVLFNSLVAHGRNTGEEFAKNFSNANSSFKSSLGFYTTGEVYNGKHGMSLRLDGLEKGVNNNARARGVVVHAASYVSESFIKQNKRLGRSQGCPALPAELSKDIINVIKDKSCLFIYSPTRTSEQELHI